MVRLCAFAAYILVALSTTIIIAVAGNLHGQGGALRAFTRENGVVEWGSVVALFAVAGVAGWALLRDRPRGGANSSARPLGRWQRGVLWLLLGAGLVAAAEEISWGQQVFGFGSGDFFRAHNLQRETNLHNLMPASISSSIINTTIYALFLWLPCWIRLAPGGRLDVFAQRHELRPFLPGIRTMLIFAFASTLQAYFLWVTWTDTLALAVTLFLLGLVLRRTPDTASEDRLHFACLVACTLLFGLHHEVFRFANMQYEIRELLVVLGCLHWLSGWALPAKESSHAGSAEPPRDTAEK
ncbi:MAG: hypothetical protein VCC00_01615 [Deltaproteobacteria bacterium]